MADQYVESGVVFLRSQNIQPFKLAMDDVKYISPEFHQKLRKSALRPGDVAVIRTGYPGTAAVIPETLPIANCADLVVVRPADALNPWFLASIFNSAWGRSTVAGNLVGVAQQHFNIGAAKEMLVSIPDVSTQRKIAAILSAYDDLIENNTRRIKILEEMAQALYREWFVHFRFPGHEKVKMVASPVGPIPQRWQTVKLGSVADVNALSIKNGEEPEHINYIDISSVSPGRIDKVDHMAFKDAPGRARRIVRHGDTIWSTVRPNRRSYSLILDPMPNLIVSTGFAVISSKAAPFSYVYHAVTTEDFVGYLTNHARGSAYPAVIGGDFENADFLLPAPKVMADFHKVAGDMLVQCRTLMDQNANLRRTRDLLLPKLISGELDVSNLDIHT
jgi:type I restriction enzyme S subunit